MALNLLARRIMPTANQHGGRFGRKAFRVLTVTTDDQRKRSMQDTLRQLNVPNSPGAALFLFATRPALRMSDPFAYAWCEGTGRQVRLV
jgi:hypothetical protein